MRDLTLLVDVSEPRDIIAELSYAGIPVEVVKLDVGDYVVGHFLIERKESKDFLNSIYDSRLFRQLKEMNDQEEFKPVLIVHGPIPPRNKWIRVGKSSRPIKVSLSEEEKERRLRRIIAGLSTALNSYPRVSVLLLKDLEHFCLFLIDLYYRQTEHKSRKPVVKRKAESIEDYKWNIFSQFPGIGSKGATTLLESGISILELASMSPEEIQKRFRGIGKKRATLIHQILTS